MFSIGEFASIGRVSIRMLRHYDEIGLLTPAHVDPFTGYRWYQGTQFAALGEILTYKDLGFRLDEVAQIVQGNCRGDALLAMLAARRLELSRQLDLDAARLRRLDARLRLLEGEPAMSTFTPTLKPLPTIHLAQASAVAPGFGPENIGPVIGPLFEQLRRDLAAAGIALGPNPVATYEALEQGNQEGARANAAYPINSGTALPSGSQAGFSIVDLPAVELAATAVHHGSPSAIGETWAALHAWIDSNGYQLAGICREVYMVSVPEAEENWVTELQQPVVPG